MVVSRLTRCWESNTEPWENNMQLYVKITSEKHCEAQEDGPLWRGQRQPGAMQLQVSEGQATGR